MSPSEGDRCPGHEKNRDWLWGRRGDRGNGQPGLQEHRAELGEEEEKEELRKDKQSSIETRISGFCKEREVRRESLVRWKWTIIPEGC